MAVSAPSSFVATGVDKDTIDLSWINEDTYDKIEVYRAKDSDSGFSLLQSIGGSETSYTDPSYGGSNLDDGTRYYYYVKAWIGAQYGDSAHDYGETTNPAPDSLVATAVNKDKITLTWNNNSSQYSHILIERKETCPSTGSWSEVYEIWGGNESKDDTTVKDGRTYEYRIRARNDPNNVYSSYSSTDSATTPLEKPNNLEGTSASDGSYVDLTWTEGSETEDGFEIYRDDVLKETTNPNVESWRDTGVSPKTTYEYKIRAIGPCNNSNYEGPIEVYTDAPPTAPSDLEAEAVSTTQINLSWEDNSDDETGFKIEEDSGGGFTQIDTVGANETSYERTGLSAGTNYNYRVRAYNNAGNSSYSNEADATTQSDIAQPTSPTATAVSDTEIEITFQDNSNAEDDHRIERKPSGGSYSEIKTLEANRTYYKDTGLTKGQKYYYRIRAKQGVNYSSYSDAVHATTIDNPTAPSNLVATAESDEKIRLTWDGGIGETGHKIEQYNGSWSEIAVIGADIEEFLITGLNPSTNYNFRVRAYNAAGNSSYSNGADATTDSEYSMTEFEKFARNPNAKPVFLAEINPKIVLQSWSLTSGKTYTYEYTITERGIDIEEVHENGTAYTEKSSITEVESNASSFYCDYHNRMLYVHTSDGSDPSEYYMEGSFWLYFSTHQTKDGDIIYNNKYYFPYLDLDNIPDISTEIKRLYQGNLSLSSGKLKIRNVLQGDGVCFFDKKFARYTWRNRRARIKAGREDFSKTDYKTIYTGLVENVECEDEWFTLDLVDIREGLWRMLPANKYWTSNYSDLEDANEGVPIPVLFGSIKGANLVLIDSTNNKYKFHDGRVKSVTAVYDKDGTTLTENTDYYVDLQRGIIEFDEGYTIAEGDTFTIDFSGIPDSAGNLIQNGADIFKYICNEYLGLENSELDLDSIYDTKYEKEKDLTVFMHLQKSSNTYFRSIERSLEAYSFQDTEGRIGLRTFTSTVPSDVKYISDHQIFAYKQSKKRDEILYQVNVFYNETPSQTWSAKTFTSNPIQWAYRITEDIDFYTYLTTVAQVNTLGNNILDLINKDLIEFSVRNVLYGCQAGDLVKITRSRYYNSDGSATEKILRILQINKSFSSGETHITAEEV